MPANSKELKDIYMASTSGPWVPPITAMNGHLVNEFTGTNDYDVSKAYLVTPDGIWELTDGAVV